MFKIEDAPRELSFGRRGEHGEQYEFDFSAWAAELPGGAAGVTVILPYSNDVVTLGAAQAVVDGTTLTVKIDTNLTLTAGRGTMVIRYVVDGHEKRSRTIDFTVEESHAPSTGEAPDPVTDWVSDATAKLAEVDPALGLAADATLAANTAATLASEKAVIAAQAATDADNAHIVSAEFVDDDIVLTTQGADEIILAGAATTLKGDTGNFNMRGDYNPDADPLYSLFDLVSDGGGSFVYINDTPSNESTSSASHWQQIAAQGDPTSTTPKDLTLADAGNHFPIKNVEAALQYVGGRAPHIVNAAFYGVLPSSLDNSAALVTAFTSGNDIYIESGDYIIATPCVISNVSGLRVYGDNVRLFWGYDEAGVGNQSCIKFDGCTDVVLDGIEVLTEESDVLTDVVPLFSESLYGIWLDDCERFIISRCTVSMVTDGFSINDSRNVSIENCIGYNCGQEIAVFRNCVNCSFTKNEGYWHLGDGVIVKHWSEAEMSSFTFVDNYLHDGKIGEITQVDLTTKTNCGGGFTTNIETQPTAANNTEGLVVKNNRFIQTGYGVLLANVHKAIVDGNTVNAAKDVSDVYYIPAAMGLDYTELNNPADLDYYDIKFINNSIDGAKRGIHISKLDSEGDPLFTYEDILISNNIIRNCQLRGLEVYNCLVVGNIISNCEVFMRLQDCRAYGNECHDSTITSETSKASTENWAVITLNGANDFCSNKISADYGAVFIASATGIVSNNNFDIDTTGTAWVIIDAPTDTLTLDGNLYQGLKTVTPYIVTDNGKIWIDGLNTSANFLYANKYKIYSTTVTLTYSSVKSLTVTLDLTSIGFANAPAVSLTMINVGVDASKYQNSLLSTTGLSATSVSIRLLNPLSEFVAGDTASVCAVFFGK